MPGRARLRLGDALVGDRVVAQVSRHAAFDEPHRRLQALHEGCHRGVVEARRIEPLEAEPVRLVLVLAGEVDLCWIVSACVAAIAPTAASPLDAPPLREARIATRESSERHQHRILLRGECARDVVLRHVGDFVRQHARELRFRLREQDQAGVDADEAAGQRERIDLRIGHREELEVLLDVGRSRDQPVPELVQVVVDLGIVDIAAARAELAHDRLAELPLLRRREIGLRDVAQVGQVLRIGRGQRVGCGGWRDRPIHGKRIGGGGRPGGSR